MKAATTRGFALGWILGITASLAGLAVGPQAMAQEKPQLIYGVTFEQLEYRFPGRNGAFAWDGDAVVGTDEWKFRWQSQGEYADAERVLETFENLFLVQWPVSTFFDMKAGLGLDSPKGPDRWFAVIGWQGLAPQWFEVDADVFFSEKGKLSARLDADYELLLTNRLILTPTLEVDVGLSDDREIGAGAGLRSMEFGLRLSYDLVDRSVSPYIGVHFEQLFGETKRFARDEGESTDDLRILAGVRLRF